MGIDYINVDIGVGISIDLDSVIVDDIDIQMIEIYIM